MLDETEENDQKRFKGGLWWLSDWRIYFIATVLALLDQKLFAWVQSAIMESCLAGEIPLDWMNPALYWTSVLLYLALPVILGSVWGARLGAQIIIRSWVLLVGSLIPALTFLSVNLFSSEELVRPGWHPVPLVTLSAKILRLAIFCLSVLGGYEFRTGNRVMRSVAPFFIIAVVIMVSLFLHL